MAYSLKCKITVFEIQTMDIHTPQPPTPPPPRPLLAGRLQQATVIIKFVIIISCNLDNCEQHLTYFGNVDFITSDQSWPIITKLSSGQIHEETLNTKSNNIL